MHAETYSSSIDELADREAERSMLHERHSAEWCAGANTHHSPAHHRDEHYRKPVVVDADGLLATPFTPRDKLMEPWLTTQGLAMIYAARGTGKTHVALGIAYALASAGIFLGWRVREAVRVLYLDGEMPGADLKQRVASIIENSATASLPGYLRFMTPDMQPDGIMPNLRDHDGQRAIEDALGDAKVIIVDNLSCLVRGGKENEGESWQPVAEWALRMRSSGRSVVFIHHAGKGGQQRGTSKREDLLDTVIALRRPSDYMPDQGARFEIHFEKARALYGEDVSPFEATLETLADGKQQWGTRPVADASDEQMVEMSGLGLSTREIGAELGVNHSTVVRALNRMKAEGRHIPKPAKKSKQASKHWSETDEN